MTIAHRIFWLLLLTSSSVLAQFGLHDQAFVARLTTSSSSTSAAFTPTNVTIWLKPESLSGSDGDSIIHWPDSSGNSFGATNVAAYAPLLTNNFIGTYEGVGFNGSDSRILFGTNNTFLSLSNIDGITLFMVAKMDVRAASKTWFWMSTPTSGDSRGVFRTDASTNMIVIGRIDDGDALITSDSAYLPSGWNLFCAKVVPTDSAAYIYTNGVAAVSDTSWGAGDKQWTNSPAAMRLGSTPTTGYAAISIIEVLLYNRVLGDAERQAVEGYITTKFGVYATWNP